MSADQSEHGPGEFLELLESSDSLFKHFANELLRAPSSTNLSISSLSSMAPF